MCMRVCVQGQILASSLTCFPRLGLRWASLAFGICLSRGDFFSQIAFARMVGFITRENLGV